MSFFRNIEIKKSLIFFISLSIAVCFIGFLMGAKYGLFCVFISIIYTTIHYIITYKRYKKIKLLSQEIDLILHNDHNKTLDSYCEGELAILHSEIYKLTVKLKEQAYILKKDKTYLADSIADISHQMNTPLTSMQIIISLLSKSKLEDDEQSYQQLKIELVKLIDKIRGLTTNLLKISKLDTNTVIFEKSVVKIDELIAKSLEPLLIQMELREQKIVINIQDNADFIGDLAWTSEAVSNIMKNCMEHTPIGGEITVTAQENAIYSEIIISDSGKGIDKNDLPHLFERFYKGKNSSEQSYGIGLALARVIITNQNGTIKVKNNETKGASFIIRFYKNLVE